MACSTEGFHLIGLPVSERRSRPNHSYLGLARASRHMCQVERCVLFVEAAGNSLEGGPIEVSLYCRETFFEADGFFIFAGRWNRLRRYFRVDPPERVFSATMSRDRDFGLPRMFIKPGARSALGPPLPNFALGWGFRRKSPIAA